MVKDTQVSILRSSWIRMARVGRQAYRRTNHTRFYRQIDTHTLSLVCWYGQADKQIWRESPEHSTE